MRRSRNVSAEADITALTTLHLGCEECPSSRTLKVPSMTKRGQHIVVLTVPHTVPIVLASEVEIKGGGKVLGFETRVSGIGGVAINIATCEDTKVCPNRVAIDDLAASIERLPGVVESVVSPPAPLHFNGEYLGPE